MNIICSRLMVQLLVMYPDTFWKSKAPYIIRKCAQWTWICLLFILNTIKIFNQPTVAGKYIFEVKNESTKVMSSNLQSWHYNKERNLDECCSCGVFKCGIVSIGYLSPPPPTPTPFFDSPPPLPLKKSLIPPSQYSSY